MPSPVFFDSFREAQSRLPAGLIRTGPPAPQEAVDAACAAFASPMPADYLSFLRSFDGAELFHETIVICGVGPDAARDLIGANAGRNSTDNVLFAESETGDQFVFSGDTVVRVCAGSDVRWLAGSSFTAWLDGRIAHEEVLYDRDGEFRDDVFEIGGDLIPRVAMKQAERALRHDPGSAEAHHEHGLALQRLGRLRPATEALERAAELDATNPWPLFDLGRVLMTEGDCGSLRRAAVAFQRAADLDAGPASGRLLAEAARAFAMAGDQDAATTVRKAALSRQPDLVEQLRRTVAAATADDDAEASAEAASLLEAVEDQPRVRLPVLPSTPPPRGKRRS